MSASSTSARSHQPPSLLRRLLLWQALALVVAWLGLGALVSNQVLRPGQGAIDQRLSDLAHLLLQTASNHDGPPEALAERLQAVERRIVRHMGWEVFGPAHPVIYQVHDAGGRWVQRIGQDTSARIPALAPGGSQDFSDAQGQRWRGVAVTDAASGIEVRVAEPAELAWSTIATVLRDTLRSQLVVFIWHGLVIWLSLRVGLAPLTQLAQRIARRKAGDLNPVVIDRIHAETRPVLDELNALLRRESERLDVERNFLTDAAHELRTPLAAVSAQAHLLLQETDPQDREAAAQALQKGIERVSHLLTQLLTLARAERRDAPAVLQTLDLAELVRERVALLAGLARSRRMKLDVEAPEHLIVEAERQGLNSVIDNLVDNALRYAPAGSEVHIRLSLQAGQAYLEVEDQGPGIPGRERERVFERFYRLPGSAATGSGLGLAIVQRVVARHGGQITIAERTEPGTLVRLTLPCDRE